MSTTKGQKYSIPYGKQDITKDDIRAVEKVLTSDYLTQGPRIQEFEEQFAEYVGAQYAVAVSNGTAALHLCALSLDVKPGDKVITSPLTFAASANCVAYCGGEVVFSDIDPETYLLDPNKVIDLLRKAPKGSYKGIIPIDFAGRAVDMKKFREIADEFDLWIIEDACHAPGGYFMDGKRQVQLCGNGNYADLAIFSFHPVKHIAAGEGGMITTNDKVLYEKLKMLRTHGITKDHSKYKLSVEQAGGDDAYPGWYMEMQELGYNYRLTDMQASLGSSQLKRADKGLEARKTLAKKYDNALKDLPEFIKQSGYIEGHAYHLYVVEVKNRLGLYNFLREQGIYVQIHYIPLHWMPYYREKGWKEGDFPNVENYYNHCLSLPMYPTLKNDEQQYVIEKIKQFYS